MRNVVFIFLYVFCLPVHCQITQLYTGTTVTLKHLSCIENTVLIGGLSGNYLAKSDDEGHNLIMLPCPGPTVNNSIFQRLDKDTVFLLSLGYTELYRSTDGANTWTKQIDTTSSFPFHPNAFTFFNGREGIADYGYGNQMFRTMNGGTVWTLTTSPVVITTMLKHYGDSMVILNGSTPPATGGVFYISKNRGFNWSYAVGSSSLGSDAFFLNKDTIFVVTYHGGFAVTLNGGTSWNSAFEPPIYNCNKVYFKNAKEGYLIGATKEGEGLIIKTTNFGQTWVTFNTGIKTAFMNMIVLNDSIALLSGTNGVLLRWNYKSSIFTDLKENRLNDLAVTVFPNPVKDKLHVEFENNLPIDFKLSISNSLGQLIYSKDKFDLKQELDLSFLKPGVYYLKIENTSEQKVFKVVKE